jgi:negative regulator of genetic competence, sporulation and motility
MKIQADGEEKISVTLTKADMCDFDITYDELDYSNIETRRVIWTILDEAKKVLGKQLNIDNRLLIQVTPADDGGCFLQFTQLPECTDSKKKRLIMKKEAEPVLFCAFDVDAFMDSLKVLKKSSQAIKSYELFEHQNNFFAVIQPKALSAELIIFLLCEFGSVAVSSRKKITELYEYGKKLSKLS